MLAWYSITLPDIWRAHDYLPNTLGTLGVKNRQLAAILFIPISEISALFGGILSVQKGSPRKIAFVMIGTVYLLFLSQASRTSAVSIFVFLLGRLIASEDYRIKKRVLALAVVLAMFSSQVAMDLRSSPELGVVGLVKYLAGENKPANAESSGDGSSFSIIRTLNNVDCSLVIQTYSSKPFSGSENVDYLLLSINPLFGNMVGWYEREERINM